METAICTTVDLRRSSSNRVKVTNIMDSDDVLNESVLPSDSELRELCQLCEIKGRRLHRQMKGFERTDRYDYQRLEVLYDVTTGHRDAPTDTWDDLKAWNINEHRLLWVEIRSIGKEDGDAAYIHYSSGRQGILLCYENHKDRDDHAEGMRLHPSEVGWQSFLMATNEDRVSSTKLRAIIQHCIVNTPTKKVIYEVARSSACTRSGPDGYLEYTELDNGFFAILGSVLGTSTMHMLIDHKSQIGYRTVEKVVVFGYRKSGATLEHEKARTVMIVLSDPRQKLTQIAGPKVDYPLFRHRLCQPRQLVSLPPCRQGQNNRSIQWRRT